MENIQYQLMVVLAWYPQACKFLKLKHHLHSLYEKSIIDRNNNTISKGQN